MSIAKCKKCSEVIITTEHLEDKKDSLCPCCILKKFKISDSGQSLICNKCGMSIFPRLRDTNIHLTVCKQDKAKI